MFQSSDHRYFYEGKLWANGGLRDLLVDSGVYAGNTAMLVGKEINRDVRGRKLIEHKVPQSSR
jgi:hypothetical protein